MKKASLWKVLVVITLMVFPALVFASKAPDDAKKAEILKQAYHIQIPFIENKGQINGEGVKYYAKTFGGTVFITKDGEMVYSLPLCINPQSEIHPGGVAKNPPHRAGNPRSEGWVIKESLVGTRISDVKVEQQAITKVSYFKGKDSSNWKRGISTYNLVSLEKNI